MQLAGIASGMVSGTTVRALVLDRFTQKLIFSINIKYQNIKN